MIKNSIVWIRDDFRLQDNPALSFATNNHEFVSAIYIYDKKEFDNIREAQKWWISKSLKSLNEDLVKNNNKFGNCAGKTDGSFSVSS